jgi:arginase
MTGRAQGEPQPGCHVKGISVYHLLSYNTGMKITLIQSPYDSGHYGLRMGRGPLHLVTQGAPDWLRLQGHDVDLAPIRLPDGFHTEVSAALAIQQRVAAGAASARRNGSLPLLLAGNCNASLGLLAGLDAHKTGLVWFDAHGDFNTPDTTLSGYFDGMALAMIAGLCWRKLGASVPGFNPLETANILLVGARDLDPGETGLLNYHTIVRLNAQELRQEGMQAAMSRACEPLRKRLRRLVVHVDLDVLDREAARVNRYSSSGGLTVRETLAILDWLWGHFPIDGLALSSYDPDGDEDDRALHAAKKILESIPENAPLIR